MNDLERTATVAIRKVAVDHYDGLTAAGRDKKSAALDSVGLLIGEAAIIAVAMQVTPENFQKVAAALYEQAALLALTMRIP